VQSNSISIRLNFCPAVVIYKTPDAEVSGMGLSGTADLRTVRPLAFGTRAVAVNMRGEMIEDDALNDDVRNYGGRFSISYIDQLADGTLGVALGYAHLDSPSQNKHTRPMATRLSAARANRAHPARPALLTLFNR
jgi:hypothetical protein